MTDDSRPTVAALFFRPREGYVRNVPYGSTIQVGYHRRGRRRQIGRTIHGSDDSDDRVDRCEPISLVSRYHYGAFDASQGLEFHTGLQLLGSLAGIRVVGQTGRGKLVNIRPHDKVPIAQKVEVKISIPGGRVQLQSSFTD